nr:MAG TPA: hypothetical protein [Caudoviricetes sp.]
MSKFDFDLFTGDYPIAVNKKRYTEQQAEEIAKDVLGVSAVEKYGGFVRYGYGCDDDGEVYNAWWLDWYPSKRSCPVWAFKPKKKKT